MAPVVRLAGPSGLNETFAFGFLLKFSPDDRGGVTAVEDVSRELADHLLQIIDGLYELETGNTPDEGTV